MSVDVELIILFSHKLSFFSCSSSQISFGYLELYKNGHIVRFFVTGFAFEEMTGYPV